LISPLKSGEANGLIIDLIRSAWAGFDQVIWLARIPSLLAGILGLAVIWEMMDDWEVTDNQRLWISALTLLPGFYWLAQDAGSASIVGLLYIMSFWLLMGGQYKWAAATMTIMVWIGSAPGLILVVSLVIVNIIRDWLLLGLLHSRAIFKSLAKKSITAGLVGCLAGIPGLLFGQLDPQLPIDGMASIMDPLFINAARGIPGTILTVIVGIYLILSLMITWLAWYDWQLILRSNVMATRIKEDIVSTNFLLVAVPLIMMMIGSIGSYINLLIWPLIIWIGSATSMRIYKPHKLIMPILLAAGIIYSQLTWSL